MMLRVTGVEGGYGSVTVLRGVDLELAPGENLGIFGPNGHGKTTLLRMISGLLRPTAGTIAFEGEEITSWPPSRIVAAGLVQAQQGNTLFGDMGVAETLELAAFTPRARKDASAQLDRVYAQFPRLAERRNQRAKTLSGGERQMLSIGAALMCVPRLLILDEPTLGLSPKLKEELSQAFKAISADVPLILIEQDVELLLSVTNRLCLLEQGEIVRQIDRANAPDHAEIMAMYFGEAAL
ncbi:MAG: ABC transporter ATP-binding protein [Pseudomonadota bacterium]